MRTKQNTNLRKNLPVDKIISLRKQHLSLCKISKEVGCSVPTLYRFLKENGLIEKKRDLTENNTQLKELIQKSIQEGDTITQTCKNLGINHGSYLKIMGIAHTSKATYCKNTVDESFLDLKNPNFCYFLGFLIADGHIENGNAWICQCNASFLHKMQKIMGHTGTIKKVTKTKNPCYSLSVLYSQLYPIIKEYNIPSNKKLNAPYIDCGELESHFIRGLFDGDGCLYYSYVSGKFKERAASITTGSPYVKEGIVNFLVKNNIEHSVIDDKVVNSYFTITINKTDDIISFLNILYKDKGEAFLDRKYINFIKFVNLVKMNKEVNDIVDTTGKLVE